MRQNDPVLPFSVKFRKVVFLPDLVQIVERTQKAVRPKDFGQFSEEFLFLSDTLIER